MRIVPFLSFALAIATSVAAHAQTRSFAVTVPTTTDTSASPMTRPKTATPITPLTNVEIAAAYKDTATKTKIPATPDAAASFDLGITNWQSGQRRLELWFPRAIAIEWAVLLKAPTGTFESEPHVTASFPVVAGSVVMLDYEVYQSDFGGMGPSNGKTFTFRILGNAGVSQKGDATSSQGHLLVGFACTKTGNVYAQLLSKDDWAFRTLHVTANK